MPGADCPALIWGEIIVAAAADLVNFGAICNTMGGRTCYDGDHAAPDGTKSSPGAEMGPSLPQGELI